MEVAKKLAKTLLFATVVALVVTFMGFMTVKVGVAFGIFLFTVVPALLISLIQLSGGQDLYQEEYEEKKTRNRN